jgi:hypothetical protein
MLVAQTAIGPAWPFFGAVAVGLAPAEVVPEEHDGRLLASHEVARSVRNPLAGAAATNGNPKAAMSVISPPGSAIRTSSPFRRATALAAVSQPDVRSHLICLVRRLDGDELQAEVLGSLDEPVQMPLVDHAAGQRSRARDRVYLHPIEQKTERFAQLAAKNQPVPPASCT